MEENIERGFMKNDVLDLSDENGIKKEYYILFTFKDAFSNKHFVIYTDYSKNDEGEINTFYAYYDTEGKYEDLKKITDEKDIALIEKILNEIIDNIK